MIRRVLLLAGSLLVAGAAVRLLAPHLRGGAPETVEVVDRSSELGSLLGHGGEDVPLEDARFLPTPEQRVQLADFLGRRLGKSYERVPELYSRRASNLDLLKLHEDYPGGSWRLRTNSLGLRNDRDVSETRPDLRVLVTGDSHTDGVCANGESLCAVLGEALEARRGGTAVEVLNAGVGGYNFYHYLACLEHYGPLLRPDVFVVVAYGGNDFAGTVKIQRIVGRRPMYADRPHVLRPLLEGGKDISGLGSQELNQVVHFLNNPGDESYALATCAAITARLAELCAELDCTLLCVYLPPAMRGQPRLHEAERARILERLEVEPAALEVSDRIADGWLAACAERGLPAVDLRPLLGAIDEPLYWPSDRHLDVAGHRAVGKLLARRLAALVR